jgi:hypothetical protein
MQRILLTVVSRTIDPTTVIQADAKTGPPASSKSPTKAVIRYLGYASDVESEIDYQTPAPWQ